MKKNIFVIGILFAIISCSTAYSAPSFRAPILSKAYEQINARIDAKTSAIILDENSRKSIEARKARLAEILGSIDQAYAKGDKNKFKEQARLFREEYKAAISYTQNLKSSNIIPSDKNNIPKITSTSGSTGKNTDITYYADSFEGKSTANGNTFSQSNFSAAACNIPFNTLVQVGKGDTSVIVKLNDRPNCAKHPNLTDLTTTAFKTLGKISSGKMPGTINTLGTVAKGYTKTIIGSDAFETLGVTLDGGIPNTYLKNETFRITGKELLGKEYTILFLKSPSGKDITLGMKKGADGRFEYTYPLEEVGTYSLVVSSGLAFNTSTFLEIYVLDDALFAAKQFSSSIKIDEQMKAIETERIELPDLTAIYLLRFPSKDFHTITLKNGTQTAVYRGFDTIALRAEALASFDSDVPTSVSVSVQKSSTPFSHDTYSAEKVIFESTMSVTPGYKTEANENIRATVEDKNLIVRGIISDGKRVKNDIVLTLPNGNVARYAFDAASIDTDGNLKRGKVFEKTIPLTQVGLYLVEVNYDNGFPAFNGPIVYGNVLPILPNESDMTAKQINENDKNIVNAESLKFVNSVRARSGKAALTLDDNLNALATIKAGDMAKHNNLSHTDSNGEKINGTAKRNNIKIAGGIGENIAGGNLSFRLLLIGLANSGGHRANMLESWKKMGVGYVIKDGQIYYAQVFSE